MTMAQDRIKDHNDVKRLLQALGRCPAVTRFDEGEDTSAASLAYCFDSLEGYFRKFLDDQLPRLTEGKLSDQEMCDLLHEIGTGFGQILWHISLPKFYRYLQDEKSTSTTDESPTPPRSH
jgi:hypothetical protein